MSNGKAVVLKKNEVAPDTNVNATELTVMASGCTEITDQEDYEYIFRARVDLKQCERNVVAELGPAKRTTYVSHRDATDRFNRHMNPILEAGRHLDSLLADWGEKMKREREKMQRAADALAIKESREDLQEEAKAAEISGATKKEINAILRSNPVVQSVRVAPVFTKLSGVRTPPIQWSCVVTDFPKLVRWVAERPEDRQQYIYANMPVLNTLARHQHEMFTVPGCKIQKGRK
jgi:ElaB/YqjD/DUF883 family membrane-anchored ribosome-binding protein